MSWRVNLAKYWQYCRVYGLKNATILALRRLRRPLGRAPTSIRPLVRVTLAPEQLPTIERRISVVIPTRNAGREFPLLLRKLRQQRAVRGLEIVVVDSGSRDGTRETAKAQGGQVVEFAREQFSHSEARNKGAEAATGEYLLFTVQDALPMTDLWVWQMARSLEENGLAAVSCAEYPRTDSDLFYQFLIHAHQTDANLACDRILAWDDSCHTYMGLRSNAQLSDVAALIRRDVFSRYKYQHAYAEDLDLGVRLIRDFHKLGFLYSTRVLHSHNRTPYYFLRRGYVDARSMIEVFPDFVFPRIDDEARLYADVLGLYHRSNLVLERTGGCREVPISGFFTRIVKGFSIEVTAETALSGHLDAVGVFMQSLGKAGNAAPYSPRTNMVLPHLLRHIKKLEKFVAISRDTVNQALVSDVQGAIRKMVALHCGTQLAYCYLSRSQPSKMPAQMTEVDSELRADI